MKKLAILSALVCVGPAHASFELLLAADSNSGKILRFDGLTGASFGSFGFGSNLKSITTHKASNTCWALYGSTVRRFNYNTGAYLGEFNVQPSTVSIHMDFNGGMLYAPNNTPNVTFYDSTGLPSSSLLTNPWNAGAAVSHVHQFTDGTFAGGYMTLEATPASGYQVYIFSPTFAPFTFYFGGLTGARPAISPIGGLAEGLVWINAGQLYGFGGFGGGVSFLPEASLTAPVSLAPAHHGYFVGGKNATTPTTGMIHHYSTTNQYLYGFSTGANTNIVALSAINAPEPAGLAALGVGILAVLARKRRHRVS